jgi:hypothetical protein
LVDKK